MCGYAGGGGWGGVDGGGACADDEDGRRGEDNLEAMVVLSVADVVEVGVLVGLPIVDQRLGDVVIECYDVTTEGDWAEVSVDGTDFVKSSSVV